MAASWPSGVPFINRVVDLDRSGPLGQKAEFKPDVGLPKVRRRTTAAYREISGSTRGMTATEYANFVAFWEDDLADGVLDFTAPHPVTGATMTFRPTGEAYGETNLGAGKTRVTLSLFELPA
jgi:hypothetical protein